MRKEEEVKSCAWAKAPATKNNVQRTMYKSPLVYFVVCLLFIVLCNLYIVFIFPSNTAVLPHPPKARGCRCGPHQSGHQRILLSLHPFLARCNWPLDRKSTPLNSNHNSN